MTNQDDRAVTHDHQAILDLVNQGASVLDLGCGDGRLLSLLVTHRNVTATGIEVDEKFIYSCVERGLSVFHGDIDRGLSEYEDRSFDYVILHQSFQQVKKPESALNEALRVGRKVIVGFPNFAHYPSRIQLFLRGKTPVTPSLPYEWWNTPNLHFLTISDFYHYCRTRSITIEKALFVGSSGRVALLPNLFAEIGIFMLTR